MDECLVCSVQNTAIHHGMDICRSCAAFFKRAKLTGVQYTCRQGSHNCVPSKFDFKFMCRGCRYEKCLLVGLAYDGPLRIRAKPPPPLLERISKEFKSMISRRRVRELAFVQTCQTRVPVHHPKEILYLVPASSSFELFSVSIAESLVFFENCFPVLNKLPAREKEIIFKDYILKLGLVVGSYLTQKLFGTDSKKLMSTTCTCFDNDMPIDFYYPGDDGNKRLFESSMRSHTDAHINLFTPQFNRAQITEREFHALSALVLTEHETPISEEAEQIIDGIRQEIFQNLQSFYQSVMGLTDFSMRLGNLMSLNHIIQECNSQFKVHTRFYSTFFDVYMTEQYMKVVQLTK